MGELAAENAAKKINMLLKKRVKFAELDEPCRQQQADESVRYLMSACNLLIEVLGKRKTEAIKKSLNQLKKSVMRQFYGHVATLFYI